MAALDTEATCRWQHQTLERVLGCSQEEEIKVDRKVCRREVTCRGRDKVGGETRERDMTEQKWCARKDVRHTSVRDVRRR